MSNQSCQPIYSFAGPQAQAANAVDTPGKSPCPKRLKQEIENAPAIAPPGSQATQADDGGNKESRLEGLPQAPLPAIATPEEGVKIEPEPPATQPFGKPDHMEVQSSPLIVASAATPVQKQKDAEPERPAKPPSPEKNVAPSPCNLLETFQQAAEETDA